MIRQNRLVIQSMDVEATVNIETDKLKQLCEIGENTAVRLKHQALVVATVVSRLLITSLISN